MAKRSTPANHLPAGQKRRSKIIYWVATVWLALGMVSTGIVQLIQMEKEVDMMTA